MKNTTNKNYTTIEKLKIDLISFWFFFMISFIWDNSRSWIPFSDYLYEFIASVINCFLIVIYFIPFCFFYHHLKINKNLDYQLIKLLRIIAFFSLIAIILKLIYAIIETSLVLVNYLKIAPVDFEISTLNDTMMYMIFFSWILFIFGIIISAIVFGIKKD
ncbi:MAG: hypothetical protein LBD05_01180 [Mycoplasmataceae bacterium]|nr:hypothetical protein [Mycoplasmataceae bacterium]